MKKVRGLGFDHAALICYNKIMPSVYVIYISHANRKNWLGFFFWDGYWKKDSVENVSFDEAEMTADEALVAMGSTEAAQALARGYHLSVKRFDDSEDQGTVVWSSAL